MRILASSVLLLSQARISSSAGLRQLSGGSDVVFVTRLGTGVTPLSTTATNAVFLDAFTIDFAANGTLVPAPGQSLALPASTFTLPAGLSSSDAAGQLELTPNEGLLMLAGYDVPENTTAFATGTVQRSIAFLNFTGDLTYREYLPSAGSTSNYQVYSVASDETAGTPGRVWMATSQGLVYAAAGATSTSMIFARTDYRSLGIFNARLFASRTNNNEMHYWQSAFPITAQGQHTALNSIAFADMRGFVWTNSTEIWVADRGVGIVRMTRPVAGSSSWSRSAAFTALLPGGAGVSRDFLDLSLYTDDRTLLVSSAVGVYSFDILEVAWNNGAQPVAVAAPNTQFRGVAHAPRAPSPSPTPTPSPTSTRSSSATPTSTVSASETPSPTSSVTPTNIDFGALVRKAQAESSSDLVAVGAWAAAGGVLLIAVGLGVFYSVRKAQEIRLKKLRSVRAAAGGSRTPGSGSYPGGGLPEVGTTVMYQVQPSSTHALLQATGASRKDLQAYRPAAGVAGVREEERESKENSEGDQAMTEVPSACEINQIIFHEIEHEIGSGHMYQ